MPRLYLGLHFFARQQITQGIQIRIGHNLRALRQKLIFLAHPRQHRQRPPKSPFNPKLDIRIEPIPNHTSPASIKLKFPLDSLHHRVARLPQRRRLTSSHIHQRRAADPGTREHLPVRRERRVDVGCKEQRLGVLKILVSPRKFAVVNSVVKAAEHSAYARIRRKALPVCVRYRRFLSGIGAAEVQDALGCELLLNTRLADNIHTLVFWQLRDTGDVDGSGVRGAEDFVLFRGNAELVELLDVGATGLGGVVCDEDDLLPCVWCETGRVKEGSSNYPCFVVVLVFLLYWGGVCPRAIGRLRGFLSNGSGTGCMKGHTVAVEEENLQSSSAA